MTVYKSILGTGIRERLTEQIMILSNVINMLHHIKHILCYIVFISLDNVNEGIHF